MTGPGITIPSNRFRQFCAVEIAPSIPFSPLFGTKETARWVLGEVSEEFIANQVFFRIDLPAYKNSPASTIWVNPTHVRVIEPLTEEQMLADLPTILGRSCKE